MSRNGRGSMFSISVLGCIVVVLLAVSSCAGSTAPSPASGSPAKAAMAEPVKIGFATDISGPGAAYARSMINGVELAIEEVNAAGGLLGRKVQLLVRDSQTQPELGVSLTRDLITRDKVDALIAPLNSGVTMATSPIAKQYKKVIINTASNTEALTMKNFHPYLFNVTPTGWMEVRAVTQMIGPKSTKFAYIGGDYQSARDMFKNFEQLLPGVNPNAKIVAQAWPKLGETDYSPYVSQLVSADPEMLYSALFGADMLAFTKQANSYGLFKKTKLTRFVLYEDLKATGKDMPEGIVANARGPFNALKGPKAKEFIQKVYDKTGDYPADWTVMSYEGMSILAQGIAKAGSTDSDAIVKAIEELTYDGLRGTITFRKEDHQAKVPSYFGVTKKSEEFVGMPVIVGDVQEVPADKLWPTLDELAASRKG